MTTFVQGAIEGIDERLSQLKDEVTRLEAARAALNGDRGRPGRPRRSRTRRGPATTTRTTRRPGRRAGNTRANQAVALVKSRPGITIPQIAEAMKIGPNYLYRVMPRLESDGQVKRDGKGWRVAS